MATDEKSLSFPQSGMNRDVHASMLNEQQYTFALNAKVIILNEKNINNSINLTVPYHSFSTVSELAKEYDIEQIIIQGNKKFAENYLDGLKENYNKIIL